MDKLEQEIKFNIIKNVLRNRRNRQAASPMLGIWWLNKSKTRVVFKDKVYKTDYNNLIDYGDSIVTKKDHYEMWEGLSRSDILKYKGDPDDYTSLPRGRVIYDKELDKYVIISGDWFTSRLKDLIATEFNLPQSKVEVDYDEHYN